MLSESLLESALRDSIVLEPSVDCHTDMGDLRAAQAARRTNRD